MKRSILMLLVIGVAMIFFGCEKMDPLVPDSNADQEITSLKAAKVKGTFAGICTPTAPPNPGDNAWHDETGDWRTTGTTIWTQPDPAAFEGTAVLILDAKDKNDSPAGKWEMTWSGGLTPTDDGVLIVAEAMGTGVEGYVKGMKAKWSYTMTYVGNDFPNPENPTFFYVIEGEYYTGPVKRNGPKHLR